MRWRPALYTARALASRPRMHVLSLVLVCPSLSHVHRDMKIDGTSVHFVPFRRCETGGQGCFVDEMSTSRTFAPRTAYDLLCSDAGVASVFWSADFGRFPVFSKIERPLEARTVPVEDHLERRLEHPSRTYVLYNVLNKARNVFLISLLPFLMPFNVCANVLSNSDVHPIVH